MSDILKEENSHQDNLVQKWKPILEDTDLGPAITNIHMKRSMAVMLENTSTNNERSIGILNEAAPTNNTTGFAGWDPILIGMVRRGQPQMIAYDLAGVQPMTGPTGLAFALTANYNTQGGAEALFQNVDTAHTGTGTHNLSDPFAAAVSTGTGKSTTDLEALGVDNANDPWPEMAMEIKRKTVTAKGRALKAQWSVESAHDLSVLHGLDAETELASILSTELIQEQNQEFIRTINAAAKVGAQNLTVAGEIDIVADSSGRWEQERWAKLYYHLANEASVIGRETRRGRGNWILTTAPVAHALQQAGRLSTNVGKFKNDNLNVDETTNTFVGILDGQYKVYIDPFFVSSPDTGAGEEAYDYMTVGYKGSTPYDAGIFYCPYVPMELYRAIGENSFQPRIGFKTRYGITANPLHDVPNAVADNTGLANDNYYFRKMKVRNISG